jgi:hypothetical protein
MKLFVGGCSFSATCDGHDGRGDLYGDYLSKSIGATFVNVSAPCGSNKRIWRNITNYIMNGELTSDDILIIQYTDKARTEFFSNYKLQSVQSNMINKSVSNSEDYYDGRILKFKFNIPKESHDWTKEENNFTQLYEDYFIGNEYMDEDFKFTNYMFQTMLKKHNIKIVFLKSLYFQETEKIIPEFQPNILDICDITDSYPKHRSNGNDRTHLSKEGHRYLANLLEEHIKKLNLVK